MRRENKGITGGDWRSGPEGWGSGLEGWGSGPKDWVSGPKDWVSVAALTMPIKDTNHNAHKQNKCTLPLLT